MPGAHTKREAVAHQSQFRNQQGANAGPYSTQPEPYDGPGSNEGDVRGRSGSVGGTRSASRPGSRAGSRARNPSPMPRAENVTPNVLLRNVDFGGGAYNIFSQVSPKFASLPLSPCHSAH